MNEYSPNLMYNGQWVCPHCHRSGQVQTTTKLSTNGMLLFLFLLLFCITLPFCWIPLVTMRDTKTYCPNCLTQLNNLV